MNLKHELQKIGLTDKEAAIYIAAMELGQSPVQKISDKSKVNRSTTYVILENLLKRGIVSTVQKGKKTLFIAEPPSTLQNIIDEQEADLVKHKQALKNMLPNLNSIYNILPNKPVIRFYEGKEGLKEMQEQLLDSDVEKIYEIFPLDSVYNLFSSDEIKKHGKKRRIDQKKKAYLLYSSESKQIIENDSFTKAVQLETDIKSDIIIFGDTVYFSTLDGHILGFSIKNEAIATTLKLLFTLAYKYKKGE